MSGAVAIAVLGAGVIGRRHIEHILAEPQARLHSVVDPADDARAFAADRGTAWFPSFDDMLAKGRPDAILIATPNRMHVEQGLASIAAGLPTLVEKPISDDAASAERLVEAAERAGVALLTGHHRRHNPMAQRAKRIIGEGSLGRLVTVHGFFWLMKPDDYFDVAWRREPGAGPVLMNLIHDVDLLRWLCGEIVEVRAFQSNAVRNHAVDETTVAILRFENGALGTINVSDTVVAPWSWEHTTGENPGYPLTDQNCYHIAGTHGALSIPRLELWTNDGPRSWWSPFETARSITPRADPLRLQIQQFCRVVRGEEPPLVSGREGLRTLRATEAIARAARTGETVKVDA